MSQDVKDNVDQESLDWFDETEEILRGLEHLNRRRSANSSGGGVIVTSPSFLTIPSDATIGTPVGTINVVGGDGTYTYSLTDPSGQFTILGNQIVVASALTPGTYSVLVRANNGAGDTPSQVITITVTTPVSIYTPTYYFLGF